MCHMLRLLALLGFLGFLAFLRCLGFLGFDYATSKKLPHVTVCWVALLCYSPGFFRVPQGSSGSKMTTLSALLLLFGEK